MTKQAKTARRRESPAEAKPRYVLRLYVAGQTPASLNAIREVKDVCEMHLGGRYELEVIDLYQRPVLREGERIIAVPTLVKALPPPLKKIIGDMSNTAQVLVGLDIDTDDAEDGDEGVPDSGAG